MTKKKEKKSCIKYLAAHSLFGLQLTSNRHTLQFKNCPSFMISSGAIRLFMITYNPLDPDVAPSVEPVHVFHHYFYSPRTKQNKQKKKTGGSKNKATTETLFEPLTLIVLGGVTSRKSLMTSRYSPQTPSTMT